MKFNFTLIKFNIPFWYCTNDRSKVATHYPNGDIFCKDNSWIFWLVKLPVIERRSFIMGRWGLHRINLDNTRNSLLKICYVSLGSKLYLAAVEHESIWLNKFIFLFFFIIPLWLPWLISLANGWYWKISAYITISKDLQQFIFNHFFYKG